MILWKTVWQFLKKLFHHVIQQLHSWNIFEEKKKKLIQKDTYTPVVIAALFTIAKTWKQPKCPSADDWVKRMWYKYNGILVIKKNEMLSFAATWMGLKNMLSEIRQWKTCYITSLIYGILKVIQMNLYTK